MTTPTRQTDLSYPWEYAQGSTGEVLPSHRGAYGVVNNIPACNVYICSNNNITNNLLVLV